MGFASFLSACALCALASLPAPVSAATTGELQALHWRNIGPASAGGRVAAVAGSDLDPYFYVIGAAGGGVFRTHNGGLTWDDIWAKQHVGAIGAVAIAPSDPKTLWVGTGEAKPRNDASYGDGVWVSSDGGDHWSHRGLANSRAISKIVVDPHDPQRALVGALGDVYADSHDRGIYATSDGGRTWRQTLYVGPQSGIADIDADPRDGKLVFAAVWQFRRVPWDFTSGGPQDGLWRSRNGGATWTKLTGHGLPAGPLGRIGVGIAPSDPERVYAVIQSKHGVAWRSDDAGDTWHKISDDTLLNQRPFYNSRLNVDPTNPDHVYFSAENLIETTDGGKSYRELRGAIHQDHHGLWIARDGKRMIDSNDGGAPISLDGGKLWDWRANLTLAQIYHVGFDDENPYDVCGGLQDNDAFCGPSNSLSPLGIRSGRWRDVGDDGDGSWAWPEPHRPSAIWNVGVSSLNGQLGIFALASGENVDVSPYVRDTNGVPLAGIPYRFNWEAPIAFSPLDPGVAYFGGNVVFATRDRGRHWRAIGPDLTRNEPAHQQMAGGSINPDVSGAEFYDTLLDIAPSPLSARTLWVGTDDGLVQVTRDGGAHWRNVTMHGLAPYGRVEAVEPSHVRAARAYVAVDRHLSGDFRPYVFATDDYGRHWRSLRANLPSDQPVRVVREDPRNPNVLYVGLEQGVRVSFDRGTTWTDLRLNMPPVSIHDLRVHPRANDLVIATHGRGFYILDDATALQGLRAARSMRQPELFAVRTAYRFWQGYDYGVQADACCVAPGESVGENSQPGVPLTYYLPRSLARAPRVEIVAANGSVVRHLRGTNVAGVNRINWDLSEDAPAPWLAARAWNRGPSNGPDVVPGAFRVRLRTGFGTRERSMMVLPDPRISRTDAELRARHAFVRSLDDELSAIDDALNALDALGRRLAAHPDAALEAKRRRAYRRFTSGPVNSEDQLLFADGLRERLATLLADGSLSDSPPTAAHLVEAGEIRTQFLFAIKAYREDRALGRARSQSRP